MGSRTRLTAPVPLIQQRKEPSMAVKILVAPRQDDSILDIARSLTPPGFELVVADVGTPQFYEVEYYWASPARWAASSSGPRRGCASFSS
jgi:hypothetical protein